MERMHSEHFSSMPISALEHRHRYAFAGQYAAGTVLDIACGIGYGAEYLCGPGRADRYYGIDNDSGAISEARAKYGTGDRSFSTGDILALPFEGQMFDAVFSFETLEHIESVGAAMTELKRVLAPHGVLVGSVPDGTFDAAIAAVAGDNKFHFHRFSRENLERLLKAHFAHVQMGYAEVVIASRISRLGSAPDDATQAVELTDRLKSTHGSFYFVCGDAPRPAMRDHVVGFLPFFEDQIRWIGAVEHHKRHVAALERQIEELRRQIDGKP